jgi:hypothetical protein
MLEQNMIGGEICVQDDPAFTEALVDLIIRKWTEIGTAEPLERVLDAVIASAMAYVGEYLRSDLADLSIAEMLLDRELDSALLRGGLEFPTELLLAVEANPRKDVEPLTLDETKLFLFTRLAWLKPAATRGAASRVDPWKLLWMPAIGIKMPRVAEFMRERRTPKSKERRKAMDDKFLWRLRARILRSAADTLQPLLPLPAAA